MTVSHQWLTSQLTIVSPACAIASSSKRRRMLATPRQPLRTCASARLRGRGEDRQGADHQRARGRPQHGRADAQCAREAPSSALSDAHERAERRADQGIDREAGAAGEQADHGTGGRGREERTQTMASGDSRVRRDRPCDEHTTRRYELAEEAQTHADVGEDRGLGDLERAEPARRAAISRHYVVQLGSDARRR